MNTKINNTRVVALSALFVALQVIFSRVLGIYLTPNQKITMVFFIIALEGALLGPVPTAVSAAIADIIGYFLQPMGAYFPGFTISSALKGLLYGFLFYNKEITLKRIVIAELIGNFIIHGLLNTYWLTILTKSPFTVLYTARLPFNGVVFVINVIVLQIFLKRVVEQGERALR